VNAADTGNPMRLTCPNCSARYEVDDSLIPPEGRDVQCSNCSTTWFQPGQRARMEEPETAEAAAPQAGRAAPRRDLDPALRDILREEREREEQLRRAAAPVEEQEEMALDSAPPPDRETETDSAAPEEDDEAAAIRQMVEEDSQRPDRPGGRELFPDIEEITSTLRATTDRTAADRVTSDVDTMDRRPRRRRGFRRGFFLMVLIGLELLETIRAYLEEGRVHAEVVFLVAIVAVSRKVIIMDYKTAPTELLFGMSALIIALGLGYFLVRRALSHHTGSGKPANDN